MVVIESEGVDMRRLMCILFLLIISILAACEGDSENISLKELGIDISEGQLTHYIDTHGSFGDGNTYIQIKFRGDNANTVEKELKENENWIQLPLTSNLHTAVYGDEYSKSFVLSFDKEIPAMPEISNGYYYFKDRNSESTDSSDDTDLFSRYSFNFDIILYDTDEHILYIFKLDT